MIQPRPHPARGVRILDAAEPDAIAEAAAVLAEGGIVGIPTDTVYGLAASIARPEAIARIFARKGRSSEKAIPVLVSDSSQVPVLAAEFPPPARLLADAFWPGALTLVVRARLGLPQDITSAEGVDRRTVALRMPDSDVARAVIRAGGGALAVTSANRSGQPPCLTASAVAGLGAAAPDLVLDHGRSPGGVPSTIVTFEEDRVVVLRSGAISPAQIQETLEDAETETRSSAVTV